MDTGRDSNGVPDILRFKKVINELYEDRRGNDGDREYYIEKYNWLYRNGRKFFDLVLDPNFDKIEMVNEILGLSFETPDQSQALLGIQKVFIADHNQKIEK
jgi:hypothetical protein